MPEAARHPPFSVVGIGASAGGLEALVELLGALPPTGMAFIVVQHLDPTHESLLSEILAKKAALPVSLAVAGEALEADHVYVIPADGILTVHDGRIELKRRTSTTERPLPVDVLFSSLAVAYSDRAIGVVLSGGDADGSLGVREIKHAGGFTFAQRPESARFPSMPLNAIETGCVDQVLRPSEIAGEIAGLSSRLRTQDANPGSGSKSLREVGPEDERVRLAPVFQRLRSAHGVDFTHYKRTTITRRIRRRMMLQRIDSFDEYMALIDRDPGEVAALYQDFLIRVTQFFRDPAAFDALSQYVFPAMSEGRPTKQPIRIWVPGCATGEEVYSIAIALLEYLGDRVPPSGIQLFGTDVNDAALKTAREGAYNAALLQGVSAERLDRFFVRHNGEYRIAKDVRDLCLFARQDVTRDPPFSRLDLISCRNLLIYLDKVAQRLVLRTFHYALRPHGMLFFGPAESVAVSPELFEQADGRSRVFRRTPNTGRGAIAKQEHESDLRAAEAEGGSGAALQGEADAVPREADRLLLARFAPACVLVNQALTVLQFRGQTGPYLEPAGGPPSFDLRRLLRPELLAHVLPAIGETSKTGVASRRNVQFGEREISIEVISLASSSGGPSFLILFDDGSHPAVARVPAATTALTETEKDRRLAQLEREIEGLRDYMRAAVEDHGASQEELRSAHEEMLSANEEFQSTNEELETSKEELQSTNEELTTTIDELRNRNQELAVVNAALDAARRASDSALSYSDIIIETVREPLVVLDGALQILRVNPAFAAHLQVPRKEIEGRNLRDVGDGRWNIPELHQRLRALLTDGQPLEDWEVTLDLAEQGHQVVSLSAKRIPGEAGRAEQLLLALEDVTARAIMAGLLASDERKDRFIAMLGHELRHPLTPITHAVYLLRQGNPDPSTLALLTTIDTHTQTLTRFVNELLDLARIRRGQIEIRPQRLDLVGLVRDAVQRLQLFVEETRQHVLSLVLPTTSVYVDGDAGRLRQVVVNLVENAAKYTDPGGQITVTLEQRDDKAELRVRDTGIGIASENLERIFEPFMQSHHPLAHPSSGLGIGLTVVRRILELHSGHIGVTSVGIGQGSEFVVSLPVAPVVGDELGVQEPREHAGSGGPQLVRRVLIVDDHQEMRVSISRLASAWGHEVAVAADGASALSLAEAFQPECAIIDLSMPGMNGIELARRLRQRFPPSAQLYLIALTGYAGDDIRDGCLAAGFDAHLVKPGDIQLLQKLLGNARGDSDIRPH